MTEEVETEKEKLLDEIIDISNKAVEIRSEEIKNGVIRAIRSVAREGWKTYNFYPLSAVTVSDTRHIYCTAQEGTRVVDFLEKEGFRVDKTNIDDIGNGHFVISWDFTAK